MTELHDYDYDLPPELIAQEPAVHRERSRLLVLHRDDGRLEDSVFARLPDYLREGDLLVANQSRVIPARLHGWLPSGGQVELLLVRRVESSEFNVQSSEFRVQSHRDRPRAHHMWQESWDVMARPARKLSPGVNFVLPGGVTAKVIGMGERGRRIVSFEGAGDFQSWLRQEGTLPIPPYIRRYPDDPERYQTVYSRAEGSIAAPTAGLHFTPGLLADIQARGVEVAFLTLHVGPGTFKPVHEEHLESVRLEAERGSIDSSTAATIARARAEGRRVIAVGTTTTRLLEGLHRQNGTPTAWAGEIDVFIRPPFEFKVVDALITNFHLPRSTLLMLVSAFAGRETILRAYHHAIFEGYRFYSFGDAMLIV
jgi:S-adenosylmethionine:tRNA ribosyltransferase-isomerase